MSKNKLKSLQKNILKKIKKNRELREGKHLLREEILINYCTEEEGTDCPKFTHLNDAGLDLKSLHNYIIPAGKTVLVETGLRMKIPENCFGAVCSRSGMALKQGIFVLNAPGIVDSGYRGDIGVILHNLSEKDFFVERGDKIAQLVILKYLHPFFLKTDDLGETERSEGGFGSSGK